MDEVTTIDVGGERPYRVLVGHDLLDAVAGLLPGATQAAVLHAPPLRGAADRVAGSLERAGVQPMLVEVPDAEAGKAIGVAADCWDRLGAAGFTRTDAVVGVGGGAVTDLAGFVAACWLRGVRAVQVPTSLLGMVDAAVGGKTGVNTTAGKNLVGAFHPPAGVLCDMSTLDSLPPVDLTAGLAEVVKCGFIADPAILDLVESGAHLHLRELVERAIRVKADVVSTDLRESGLREILNYGHTLGHAIEKLERYTFRHGDAVAIGMVFAAEVARLAGKLTQQDVALHKEMLTSVGLPVTYRADAWPELRPAMSLDKKARGTRLRMIILDGIGNPVGYDSPPEDLLTEAYQAVAR